MFRFCGRGHCQRAKSPEAALCLFIGRCGTTSLSNSSRRMPLSSLYSPGMGRKVSHAMDGSGRVWWNRPAALARFVAGRLTLYKCTTQLTTVSVYISMHNLSGILCYFTARLASATCEWIFMALALRLLLETAENTQCYISRYFSCAPTRK
jgi:hypothetical protein